MGTIVGMAQDHVGTNNCALLDPLGQFGSRNDAASVHAASRYIFTRWNCLGSALFHPADDPVLSYRTEEGKCLEPLFFLPVLCLALLNGASGIATGWSTLIPPCSPLTVIEATEAYCEGGSEGARRISLLPWFSGFNGEVRVEADKVVTKGRWTRIRDNEVHIVELPVGRWTDPYLKDLIARTANVADKKASKAKKPACGLPTLIRVLNNSTESKVDLKLTFSAAVTPDDSELDAQLKMVTSFHMTNMVLLAPDGRVRRFPDLHSILEAHGGLRLQLYAARKAHQLREAQKELEREVRIRDFIHAVLVGNVVLLGRPQSEVIASIEGHVPGSNGKALLKLSVDNLSEEGRDNQDAKVAGLRRGLKELEETTAASMWRKDLQALRVSYATWLQEREARYALEDEDDSKRPDRPKDTRNPKKRKASTKSGEAVPG